MPAKKKFAPRKRRKFFWLFLPIALLLVLLLDTYQSTLVDAFKITKPGAKTVLPADIQKAIENEAIKELAQGYDYQHTDVAAEVDPQDVQIAESTILPDNPLYIF